MLIIKGLSYEAIPQIILSEIYVHIMIMGTVVSVINTNKNTTYTGLET